MTQNPHVPSHVTVPASVDAEESVIGGAFLNPEILGWLDLTPEEFYSPVTRHIWETMQALHDEGVAVDDVTVASHLEQRGYGAAIGPDALGRCIVRVPAADHVEHYAKILHDRRAARELLILAGQVRKDVDAGEPSDEVVAAALRKLGEIDLGRVAQSGPLGEVAVEVVRGLIAAMEPGATPAGVPTGLDELDTLTTGIPIGLPTVIAGRPGKGKSSFALGIADHATANGFGTLVLSYEDRPKGWAERWLAHHSGVDVTDIRARQVRGADLVAVDEAAVALRKRRNLVVECAHGWTIPQVIRQARARRKELGLQLVIVDYIQRCPAPYPGKWERHEIIEANAHLLGDFAGSDDIAVIICSQIGRQVIDRTGKERMPTLADLSGSKGLEETGKLVLALFEPASEAAGDRPALPFGYGGTEGSPLDILILKNHQGVGQGVVSARFDKPRCRITA